MSTTQSRVDRQPAFVLHRRAFRETSMLLDLLTRDHGRVGGILRGARGPRRSQAGACQPLHGVLVSWSGRSELKTLLALEPSRVLHAIAGERLYAALYVNEILLRLLPANDPHPALFDAYAALLPALAGEAAIEPALRSFELLLLSELGYGLCFDHDSRSGAVLEPQAEYAFNPTAGFTLAEADHGQATYPGWVLFDIDRQDFSSPHTRRYAKRLMRAALAPLLGDKPLLSRGYFSVPSVTPAADSKI